MTKLTDDLKKVIKGEVDDTTKTREFYSHDASLFELKPDVVASPADSHDVQEIVKYVASHRHEDSRLSVTARSAGTDMSGGAINESIIMDMSKHFTAIEKVDAKEARTQPGVPYRDFDKETLKHGAILPCYPASRDLCTVGGMVANNSGGEKSLEFGKTENFVKQLKVVLSDGNEYTLGPLNRDQLKAKMLQHDFEGQIYRKTYELIDKNYDRIKAAKPHVSKNSTGYNLWDVWDRETGIFDLTKLIVGSQGTLGIVTDITYRLVPHRPHSGLLVLFLHDVDRLGELINVVLKSKPASFESFDDATLIFTIRFMPYFLKMLGPIRFIKLLISLIPDGLQLLRGIPKMIVMVEFNGHTEDEVREKIKALHRELKEYHARYEINGFEEDPTEGKSEKFWLMRRHSFNLLRQKVKDKHTAPFIDDLVVNPQYLPEFLPQLRRIVKKYKFLATVQGHVGDGNFHIIPLMKFELPKERAKIQPAMKEVNELVLSYKGSLSGEHNDGMIRGPWLKEMYGPEILKIFREAKQIFDPDGFFNPHKKAEAEWDFSFSHIRASF
ncbi:MAG TPA: FAD-binding oxidoreductase [Candidatus Saccharimonadales bacterium]|nr:FAD-binding oxidoreductase [Candidatus Saccharimonadales bacterium]